MKCVISCPEHSIDLVVPLQSTEVKLVKMFGDLGRTPRTLLVCERSSLLDEKNRLSQQVEQQHFNYKVRAAVRVLPLTNTGPVLITAQLGS